MTQPPAPQLKHPGREIELKFLADEPVFRSAQSWPVFNGAKPRAKRLRSTYYDTAEADLARNEAVLRVRATGRRHLLTFKWAGNAQGGLFERGEIEVPIASAIPDPACLGPEFANYIAAVTGGRALAPIHETDIKRSAHVLSLPGAEVEIAFDSGTISAGEATLPVREIEMELKSGDPAALYRLGLEFAEAFPVRIGAAAKSERANWLRSGEAPEIARASTPLSGEPTVDDAIGLVLATCLAHFTGNFPAFWEGDRVKAVHQMRVAMRRLRSLIGLFQRSFPCAEFAGFRAEAREIANTMGEARNWDVFLEMLEQGPAAAFPQEPGFAKLLQAACARRDAGYAAAQNLLSGRACTCFVLRLQEFISRHGWRNQVAGETLPSLSVPAQEFGAQNLARQHRKLLKQTRHFEELGAHERHEVRKKLKKQRYATEIFGTLFGRQGQIHSYIGIVSELQDQLGLFNDLATAQQICVSLDPGGDPACARATGIILGWCAHGAAADGRELGKALKHFRHAKLFA